MSNSTQNLLTKPAQYTRKKIQNYSYGLNDVIGKGYSSQVYKGRNQTNNNDVAIKVIDLKMLKNQINRILLDSQIEILKQLKNQSNILQLHDVYTTKNNTYIITQLCSSDMNKITKSNINQAEAYFYMAQLIEGYKEIYQHQVVHRDFKPANLLLTDNKVLKIADFGFSIKITQLNKPNKYNVGSPLYMAPQSLKKNQYSYKTDLWSIGIIFFQMLTGETPWRAKTEKELIKKIQTQTIFKILQKKSFSKMTKQFLERILNFDKNNRLSPDELYRYNFKSQSQGNVLCERPLNGIINRTTRFDSLNSNTTNFISPKHVFNQSIEKNFFQKPKSQKTMISVNNSSKNLILLRKQAETQKQITKNQVLLPQQKKVLTNPQLPKVPTTCSQKSLLKAQQKKSISKVLISIVHFCRFLFKLLNRLKQSQTHGILKEIGYFEVQSIYSSYTQIIKYLINLLVNFDKINFMHLVRVENYQAYKDTNDFHKLMKISNQYYDRYSTELKPYWIRQQTTEQQAKQRFSSEQTVKLIQTMTTYTDDIVKGMEDPQVEVNKMAKDTIIIDYLMTSKQLLEMFTNGVQDFLIFSKKSRIQDIVQGSTSQITLHLYKKIIQKAHMVDWHNSQQKITKPLLASFTTPSSFNYRAAQNIHYNR